MLEDIQTDFCRKAGIMPAAAFAALMGWTVETEQQQRSRGLVPPSKKIGRTTFYAYSDVADFINHRTTPTSDKVNAALLEGGK